jgi:hypothetical protein
VVVQNWVKIEREAEKNLLWIVEATLGDVGRVEVFGKQFRRNERAAGMHHEGRGHGRIESGKERERFSGI